MGTLCTFQIMRQFIEIIPPVYQITAAYLQRLLYNSDIYLKFFNYCVIIGIQDI